MTKAERCELWDDLRDERDSIDADIDGWKTEIEDAIEQIKERKAEIAAGKARKAEIRKQLADLKAAAVK